MVRAQAAAVEEALLLLRGRRLTDHERGVRNDSLLPRESGASERDMNRGCVALMVCSSPGRGFCSRRSPLRELLALPPSSPSDPLADRT